MSTRVPRIFPTNGASMKSRETDSSGGPSPRRSHPHNLQALATALAKANERAALRAAYDAWVAFRTRCHQQTHLKRCAVALKHSNHRQQYTRVVLRWLAATQRGALQEAKRAYVVPREFPLRTKKDVLSLVSRYFNRWRRHLRERRQRTVTNVATLVARNEDRTRATTFAAWLAFRQQRRNERVDANTEDLLDQLRAREKEVALLQDAVERVASGLSGKPAPARAAPSDEESAVDSLAHSKALADALQTAFEEVNRSARALPAEVPDASGKEGTSSEPRDVPLAERLRALGEGKSEAERAREAARGEVDKLNELVTALLHMLRDGSDSTGHPPATGSNPPTQHSSPNTLNVTGSPTRSSGSSVVPSSPARGRALPYAQRTQRGANTGSPSRLTGSPQQLQQQSPSRTSTGAQVSDPFEAAKVSAEKLAMELAEMGNSTPLDLLEGTAHLVTSQREAQADLGKRAAEVADLREAALRAIDSLGGRREKNEALFVSQEGDSVEQSAARSNAIASSLSELCEDLVVVLVLASLWSQDGQMEKVSESLERMWRSLNQAEKNLKWEVETSEEVMQVVAGCAELLGAGIANSAHKTDQLLEAAKKAAETLRSTKQQPLPQCLLDCCLALEGSKVSELKAAEEQRQTLQAELDEAQNALAQAQRSAEDTTAALHKAEDELANSQQALADKAAEVQDAQRRLEETEAKLADVQLQLDAAQDHAKDSEKEWQQELAKAKDSLAASEKDLADTQKALVATQQEAEQAKEELQQTAAKLEESEQALAAMQDQAQQAGNDALQAIQEKDEAAKSLQDTLARAEEELANAVKELRETQQALEAAQQMGDEAQQTIQEQRGQAETLQQELAKAKDSLAASEKDLADTQKALVATQQEAEQAKEELQQTAAKLEESEQALAAMQDQAQQAGNDALQTIQAKDEAAKSLQDTLARSQEELANALKELRETQQALEAAQQMGDEAQQTIQEQRGQAETLQQELAKAKDSLAASEKDLADTQRALVATQQEAEQAKEELQQTAARLKEAENHIAAAKQQADEAAGDAEVALQASEVRSAQMEEALTKTKENLAAMEKTLADTQQALAENTQEAAKTEAALKQTEEALSNAQAALVEAEHALEEEKERTEQLRAFCDDLAALLHNPTATPRSTDAVTDKTAGLSAPAKCLEQIEALRDKLQDALQGMPETVAGAPAVSPDAPLSDQVAALAHWRDELLQDMQEAIQVNANGEAIAAFLRDVLRDVIHRLVLLRESSGDDDSMLSTKVSVALDPDEPPKPLVRGDPTQYVEYILQLQGIDEESKRAVQDHLAVSAVLGGGQQTPCTWDVIADVHENLSALVENNNKQYDFLLEQKEAIDKLTRTNGALNETLDNAQMALAHWSAAPAPQHEHTQPPSLSDSRHPTGCDSLVVEFEAEVGAVVEALRELKSIVDADAVSDGAEGPQDLTKEGPLGSSSASSSGVGDLTSLVKAVADMHQRLVELQDSAEDGIEALGGRRAGAPREGTSAQGMEQTIAERLVAVCRDTGASIDEVKKILGVPPGDSSNPQPLREMLPSLQRKVLELEEVKRDSEAFVRGLDNAFNDEATLSPNSSTTSTIRSSKRLKAKKKPMPALEGRPAELMTLTHRELGMLRGSEVAFTSTAGMSPKARLNALRLNAQNKIDEVQELRLACRSAISVLDGTFVEGQKPPAYGDVLIPLLLSQLEDLKKVLPRCEDVLQSNARNRNAGNANSSVAAKLSTLAGMADALQMERDGLRGEVAGKARQNQILLEDLDAQAEKLKRDEKLASDKIKELHAEVHALRDRESDLESKLKAAEEAQSTVGEETQKLHEVMQEMDNRLAEETSLNDELTQRVARHQHDNNILTHVLAKTLVDITANPAGDSAPDGRRVPHTVADMEPFLSQKLVAGEGDPLVTFAKEQVAAIRDHWHGALQGNKEELQGLREELQAVRDAVATAWEHEFKPYCAQLLATAQEGAELLRLENDKLRPRALEREALVKENKALRHQLAEAEADLAAAEQEAHEATRMTDAARKALSEAQVEQVIRAIPQSHPNRPAAPGINLAELERRMIHGATSLTMEAIDAMAGDNMAHTFGDVAAQTVKLFHSVEQCVHDLQEAFCGYEHTRNPLTLAASVEAGVAELDRMSQTADDLWANVPVLFQTPYTNAR